MNIIDRILKSLTLDVGIDLGTSSTLVSVKGIGIVAHEPSVVALNKNNNQVLAVGNEAKKMVGRTPANVVAIRPLRDGVITDFDTTEAMLRYFIEKVHVNTKSFKIPRPRVVIGIPSAISEVEAKAVKDAAISAGARAAYTIEEPMAAAIGAGLPINEATGSMIIDIGGGTSDIAVISLGGIVVDNTIRIAGDEMDLEIISHVKNKYGLLIGERTAEDIKIRIGSAWPLEKEQKSELRGRDLVTGLPRTIEVSSVEIREALLKVLEVIAEAAKEAIEKSPPEILSDLLDRGIMMAGGGSMLWGIDKFFESKLNTPIVIAGDPITCVVKGCTMVLDQIELFNQIQADESELI
ncbi:MAG: rod shape-determining protein [bacterium]